jgi:hypothetical protein
LKDVLSESLISRFLSSSTTLDGAANEVAMPSQLFFFREEKSLGHCFAYCVLRFWDAEEEDDEDELLEEDYGK